MSAIPFSQRISCTVDEACEVAGIGRVKMYELIGSSEIETTRIGRRRLVLVRSLFKRIDPAFAAAQSQDAAA